MTHDLAGYRAGCRCDTCKAANAEKSRQRRKKAKPPQHGTFSAYRNHGCRCDLCWAAGQEQNRLDREKIKQGQFEVSHGTDARAALGCDCDPCFARRNEVTAATRQRNASSRAGAHRRGQQWTGAELEIALARDERGWARPAAEVAAVIGRTIAAVNTKRAQERDPRVGGIAGAARAPRKSHDGQPVGSVHA